MSSLGHTVLVPALLHWHFDRRDPTFFAFVVALHLGTALALIAFYRRDWARIVRALAASVARGKLSDDPDERVGWLLVVGTVPVALLGVFLEATGARVLRFERARRDLPHAQRFVMFAGEWLRRREPATAVARYRSRACRVAGGGKSDSRRGPRCCPASRARDRPSWPACCSNSITTMPRVTRSCSRRP
jgi:undecaprenyl-diphosphatase